MTTTESYSLGDIVLLKFPFTDGKSFKKRPALVILDSNDGDVIVCRITSKLYNSEFDIELTDWKKCGLLLPSVVRIHKIATLEKETIDKKIGSVSDQIIRIIEKKFNSVFC